MEIHDKLEDLDISMHPGDAINLAKYIIKKFPNLKRFHNMDTIQAFYELQGEISKTTIESINIYTGLNVSCGNSYKSIQRD